MNEDIRIKDLPLAEDGIQTDDYLPVDGATDGTRKITMQNIVEANVSGLETEATNTKGAINELFNKASRTVSLTQAEYDALPASKLSDDIAYYITDGEPDVDNTLWAKVGRATLDTQAQNCSEAINELNTAVETDEGDISEIKQSLSNLGIVCESIVNNETITSTETTYNTYNGRKFSDYSVLIFIMKYTDTDMRASMTIPQNMWKSGGMIPLKALHGSTASGASTYNVGGMTFIYNSDTKINMFTNGTNTFSVASVVGVKLR